MAWTDRLRPASYDGAPFGVFDWEDDRGRRAVLHEYPQRDHATLEDLGRSPRRHRIGGFVVGDDFLEKKEALDLACERTPTDFPTKVGKVFVHPFLGQMLAHCERITWRAGSDRGRMASFVASFIEVDEEFEPLAPVVDPVGQVDAAADAAELQIGAVVEEGLEVSGIELVRLATSQTIDSIGRTLNGLQSFFRGPSLAVSSLGFSIASLISNAKSLAIAPANLVHDVLDAIGRVSDAVGNFPGALSAYEALADRFERPLFGGKGSASGAAQANADLVARLLEQSAALWAARTAVRVPWRTYEEATSRRDALLARLDALALEAAPPVYRELARVSAVLVDAVPPIGEDLPRLETVVLGRPTPALVLASRLYDDVSRASELAIRNRVHHPTFMPAGRALQVLSE